MTKKILFVCTGNTCRSPMAKAILSKKLTEHELNTKIKVDSAGLYAVDGMSAAREAVETVSDYGGDLSDHHAKMFNEAMLDEFDLILTMTESHKKQIIDRYPPEKTGNLYTLSEYVDCSADRQDIRDPLGGDIRVYKDTYEQLEELISRLICKLVQKE